MDYLGRYLEEFDRAGSREAKAYWAQCIRSMHEEVRLDDKEIVPVLMTQELAGDLRKDGSEPVAVVKLQRARPPYEHAMELVLQTVP